MGRFSRSRGNSISVNNNNNNVNDPTGFATSAAAGGVAADLARHQSQQQHTSRHGQPPTHVSTSSHHRNKSSISALSGISSGISPTSQVSPSSQVSGTSNTSGTRSKITSGISTLFRRQPSPDFGPEFGSNNNLNMRVDPSGVHVGSGVDNNISPRGQQHNSSATRSGGNQYTNQDNRASHHRKYSATQRDNVLNSQGGMYDDDMQQQIPQPISSSYSRSLQNQHSSTSYNNQGGVISSTFSEGVSDDDGYASSGSDRGRKGDRSRSRDKHRSSTRNSDPHNMSSRSKSRGRSTEQRIQLPRRYKGFSTSISSLFIDESIVCGAISCCGLLLSSRTEYLLNERNVKRGMIRRGVGAQRVGAGGKEGGARTPSRILGIAYVVTIVSIVATYAIFGFEDGDTLENDWYDEYNNDFENGNGQQGDDDAVANDDVVQEADDAVQQNDDANQRMLLPITPSVAEEFDLSFDGSTSDPTSSSTTMSSISQRHSFIGVMKMRDHKEYVFDPVVGVVSQAYSNLMDQFDADEYHPQPLIIQSTTQPQQQHQHRQLEDMNEGYYQGSQVRMFIIAIFLFILGVIGRRRRMRTRFAILRSRAQDDHLYYASVLTRGGGNTSASLATPDNTVMENFHEREDKYDGACSHTLFGCYPVDSEYSDRSNAVDDETCDDVTVSTAGTRGTSATTKRLRKGGDFMGRTMKTIFNCCCGKLCKCWCQVFSICALAQEAREARLLLPPSMQRIDMITHQPFHEYHKELNNVRRRFMERASRTWIQHWSALSRLSRYILLMFVLCTVFVIMTMVIHPMGGFDWGDALVLIATFSQSFVVLFIVFGIFHRSDLSFDAVVKFFAVGFCICVPVGFVLEGVVINGLFSLFYIVYYTCLGIGGDGFEDWMSDNYRWLSILGELINAYFVAALVEELCKYYGFRFVEHPDLLFLTGLDRTAKQTNTSGGIDSYKYDSQLVSDFSRSHESDGGESVDSRGRRKRNRKKKLRSSYEDDEEDEEPDIRTLQQQAAAITTGMISVAVGLACAENFLYVFFLGGTGGDVGNIGAELTILLFRSIFPVHALSAAMQSINMIRKFIEEKHGAARNMGVGKIIFPAILLHGTFDAILMCVNAFIEASWDSYYEDGGRDDDATYEAPFNVLLVNLIAAIGILGVMGLSFAWYTYQNRLQISRLSAIDVDRSVRSGRSFNAPNIV